MGIRIFGIYFASGVIVWIAKAIYPEIKTILKKSEKIVND